MSVTSYDLLISRSGQDLIAVPIDRDRVRVGRASGNDVCLPDPSVSRFQCELSRSEDGGKLVLQDKSGKGTGVGVKTVERAELEPGSRFEVGTFTITFREREEPEREMVTSARRLNETKPISMYGGAPAEELFLAGTVNGKEVRIKLSPGALVTFGSDSGNVQVLKDQHVSRFHCRIFFKAGEGWFVRDLESTNGTWLNGAKVVEARLQAGANLTIGKLAFRVQAAGEVGEGDQAELVSVDPEMARIKEWIRKVAPTDDPVLINGETGSGKELVARSIHRLSKRAERPLVAVNCATIPKDLVESELFGYEKGAFTGAQTQKAGLFEKAAGGTIFLDEIGEILPEVQAKLLRTLDSGEVRRVGSSVPTHVDVRVIAATNRPLQQMVKEGKFRDDLYFRINVLRVEIPPLRKRPADIVRLAQHFLAMAVLDKRPLVLSEEAKASLQAYGFPGNVRELKNIITAAAVQAAGPEIRVTDLSLEPPTLAEKVEEALMLNQDSSIEEAERAYLKLVLDLAHGNKREAAKLLGLPRTTFLYKLEKYGLL